MANTANTKMSFPTDSRDMSWHLNSCLVGGGRQVQRLHRTGGPEMVAAAERQRGGGHRASVWQHTNIFSTFPGLLNVPFWVYWTSPYSSHYRPYT